MIDLETIKEGNEVIIINPVDDGCVKSVGSIGVVSWVISNHIEVTFYTGFCVDCPGSNSNICSFDSVECQHLQLLEKEHNRNGANS